MPRLRNEDIDQLGAMLAAEEMDDAADQGEKRDPANIPDWEPLLNPVQREGWEDQCETRGYCGPKFSGKTTICLHDIVRHCYQEWDALFWILGNNAAALAEGACSDLTKFILPTWRDGNVAPPYIRKGGILVPNPRAGERIDPGIGLEYANWRFDAQTKHPIMRIKNRFGGWSRIRVISIPHEDMIDERVRGPAPSGIYLEEATKCGSDAYFTFPSLQLNRRRDIDGIQPFLFSCNPEDPENWVYDWMYKQVVVTADQPGRNWPKDPEKPGIRRDPTVSFRSVPYEENAHNVSQKNRTMMEARLKDPILRQRLLEGKWVSYPSGDSLFKDEFSEKRHMRGELKIDDKGEVVKSVGLLPVPGYPLVLSYDFGDRSAGVSFQQIIETEEGPLTLIFDELCYHRQMIKSRRLAHALVEKLRYWFEWLRAEQNNPDAFWSVWHIAGDDATTTFKANIGSVDAKNVEDLTREIIEREPDRYRGIEPFIIRGCPRPPGSREKRADLLAEAMLEDRFIVSQICSWHRAMLFHQEADKDAPNSPKKGKWTETFDAASYASMYRHLKLPGGFYDLSRNDMFSIKA